MWSLDNTTPYAAERTWIRDIDGAEVWIVAVKATYDILPDGRTRLADKQLPINQMPIPHPDLESLKYDTDLGPPKRGTDVLLIGHAYAPGGRPAVQVDVAWQVGPIIRRATVLGDRYWQQHERQWVATPPQAFNVMPLVYERAFGGDSPDDPHGTGNPVGCGFAPAKDGTYRLPNIESPEHRITERASRPPVVGFGPIPCHWPERRRWSGTYDDAWMKYRRPLLPKDIDPRYWHIAPAAQQTEQPLRGGESVGLVNLTPPQLTPNGRLQFLIPKLSLAFETRFFDGTKTASRSQIHSIIIEPDYPRVSVVHHMSLPCHPKVNVLDRTLIWEKSRALDSAEQKSSSALHSRSVDGM